MKTGKLHVRGMKCKSCEKRIEDAVRGVQGVLGVKASLERGEVEVQLDGGDLGKVKEAIEKEGYVVGGASPVLVVLGALALLAAAYYFSGIESGIPVPQVGSEAGYVALFLLGIVTGFHCIAMCGGFVLGYSAKSGGRVAPHLLYGAGKLVSYTFIGAAFGLVGSVIAFTPEMRGAAALVAGVFLVVYGLGMLGINGLGGLRFGMPGFVNGIMQKMGGRGPLVTGLLNGLMIACGPLQAMYIFAAGTGSVLSGAAALFFFGLGTLPPMLGFGVVAGKAGSAMQGRFVTVSAMLVIFLGLLMANQGLVLCGKGIFLGTGNWQPGTETGPSYQEIRMNVTYYGFEPNVFVLKKGVPVKWVIEGVSITGCNERIIVPEYGLEIEVHEGTQVVEFTPNETGEFGWSCWMGMIPGKFVVVE
ncbi:MAG: sulfite exporter TauE/SafE family protein [Candidatus Micrarchaeota archaeon]